MFPRATCPWTPLEVHTFGDRGYGYTGPKTAFLKLTGLESLKVAFLKFNFKLIPAPCELFNHKLIRNIFSCLRGRAFSAISCPAWWGIRLFLRDIKTNPHLYPGVGWFWVYFDWCINRIGKNAHIIEQPNTKISSSSRVITKPFMTLMSTSTSN